MPLGGGALEQVGVRAVVDGFKPYMQKLGKMESKTKGFGSKIGSFLKMGALVGGTALIGLGAAALKIGGEFDKAYDKIRVGTGATGEALEGLKGDFKKVFSAIPTDMESASDAVTQFNTLTGATGPALVDMAKSGLEAARMLGEDSAALIGAAGKAFNVFEVSGDAANGVLDAVFAASQATNVPMAQLLGTLQTYGPVLKNLGFGIIESTAFFASLEKAGIDVSRVMPGLNAFMRKLADEGVTDLSGALNDQIEQIKGAETESEALNLATQAFGAEGAQRLSVAIRTGALDLEDFTKTLYDSEGAILDTAKASESWTDKLKILKNKALVKLEPILIGLFDGLTKLFTLIEKKVIPALEKWWKTHGPKVIGFFEDIGRFIKTDVLPKLKMFGQFLKTRVLPALQSVGRFIRDEVLPVLQQFGRWLGDNKEVIAAAFIGFATVVAAVLVPAFVAWTVAAGAAAVATIAAAAPVIAIGLVIAALALGIIMLVKHWDEVVAFVKQKVVPMFTGLWDTIDEFLGNLPVIGEAWEVVKQVVKDKVDAVIGIVQGLIDFAKELISFFKNVFSGEWGAAWADLKDMAKIALDLFLDYLELIFLGTLKSIFTALGLWDWAKGAFETFKTEASNFLNGVVDMVRGIGGDIAKALGDGLRAAKGYVTGTLNAVITAIERGVNFMIRGINNIGDFVDTLGAGVNAVLGFFGAPKIPSIPNIPEISIPRLHRGAFDIPRKMLAQLHPGEMVLPRPQAEVVREAVLAPSVAPQAAAVTGGGVDPAALAAAVATALQGMTMQMDGRVVGSLVNDRIGGDTFMLGRGG